MLNGLNVPRDTNRPQESTKIPSADRPGTMSGNATQLDNETLLMLQNRAIAITLPVVYSLVAVISIPGNLFSLWLLCRHTKPKSPSVIFMINLGITDLLLAAFLPFQIFYHIHHNDWIFGKTLCNLVTLMFYSNMYSSILTMTLISVERYLGVVHPMSSSRWRKNRYAVGALVAMWTLLLATLSPLILTDLTYEVKALGVVTCFDVLKWTMLPNFAAWVVFLFSLFIVLFLIPFGVTVVCYVATIRKLVRVSGRDGHGQTRRSVKLAGIVLLVFVTCFAPNNFVLLAHMVNRLFFQKSYYHIYKLTLCLSCLNNCLDPFVYYFASKEFYQTFRNVIGSNRSRSDSSENRRESVFSGQAMSLRSTSSGQGDGPEPRSHASLMGRESVF
ncbi:P2Y purinoceptor 8-like [Tachyglossus aculeatus]|uniref:P2Y purinoceptor 8-like n=1 Tax=Tachyglossus aculeatus TaxID=9261 RepID=UPI0018F33B21|nr:P2Y purinoceptor 8-like [Tachyglossus aculeatus]